MKKRGIDPKVDLLTEIPFLGKVSKSSNISYLALLRQVLRFPIMGNRLRDLSIRIPVELPEPELSERSIVSSAYLCQMVQAIEKMEEAMTEVYRIFGEDEQSFTKAIQIFNDTNPVEGEPDQTALCYSREGAIYTAACSELFRVKGWKHQEVPHPASIAAIWVTNRCTSSICLDVPDLFNEPVKPTEEHLLAHLRSIGKLVGSMQPREADVLMPTAGNLGTEFVRNQISHFTRFSTLKKEIDSKPVRVTYGKWKVEIQPSILDDENNLFTDAITGYGEMPQRARGTLLALGSNLLPLNLDPRIAKRLEEFPSIHL